MLIGRSFIFLRHGETEWNRRGLSQGRSDIALNETGVEQARAAASLLMAAGIKRIVSSTLVRAQQTATIVADVLKLEVPTDADLREASFGIHEGTAMGDWYDGWVAGHHTPEGGERFADLQVRALGAVNRALQPPGLVLIVAHGSLFRSVRAAMGLSAMVRTDNGVPLRCTPGRRWTIEPISPG